MQIDWFTFFAQIVNFAILVILLKYLLYDKIIAAIEEREENISSKLKNADNKEVEAEKKLKDVSKKEKELEEKKKEQLSNAKEEAEKKRKELVEEAKNKVDQRSREWRSELENQKDDFLQGIRTLISEESFKISRQALKELADSDLENMMFDKLVQKIQDLGKKDKEKVADKLNDNSNVIIKSSFELKNKTKDELKKSLNDIANVKEEIKFETDKEIICGVEISIGSSKIGWNFDDYLDDLDSRFQEAIKRFKNGNNKNGTDEKEKSNSSQNKKEE